MDTIRRACTQRGFSDRVAALAATPQRASTTSRYDYIWKGFCTWLESNGSGNPFEVTAPIVAEYLLSLLDLGRELSTIRVHKSAICTTIKCGGGPDHAVDPTIQALLRSLTVKAPPRRDLMPRWDLNIVLLALCKPPFEPLETISARHLSFKTAFLISWGTASRVSELHALSMDDDHLQWGQDGKWVDLTAGSAFMAKNQKASHPPRRFRLQALEQDRTLGTPEMLCPIRALSAYLDRTKATRGEQTKLFISLKSSTSGVSIQTLARWLRETIKCCYESQAPQELADASGAHAHELRALASSLAVAHHKPIKEVMRAAYWKSESCFSTFYLKDMAKYQARSLTGMKTYAAGFSLDI